MTNEVDTFEYDRGVTTLGFDSWLKCVEYVNKDEVLNANSLVWRGHASEDWKLEPTLDRLIEKNNLENTEALRLSHLTRFQYAARGRRGLSPPHLENAAEWWALGQHHGLATPLLDWTTSPYVAAYFAFADPDANKPDFGQTPKPNPARVIFGLVRQPIHSATEKLNKNKVAGKEPQIVTFFEPLSNENPRLVNQGGLFTNCSVGVNIEEWVKANYGGQVGNYWMVKLRIPETERETCLKSLNRMNINHLSLFPDMDGACKYTDLDLTIKNY